MGNPFERGNEMDLHHDTGVKVGRWGKKIYFGMLRKTGENFVLRGRGNLGGTKNLFWKGLGMKRLDFSVVGTAIVFISSIGLPSGYAQGTATMTAAVASPPKSNSIGWDVKVKVTGGAQLALITTHCIPDANGDGTEKDRVVANVPNNSTNWKSDSNNLHKGKYGSSEKFCNIRNCEKPRKN
jgi:hypothetical protein